MQDEQLVWEDRFAQLETSIRAGDHEATIEALLAFDAELTRYIRGEERLLFPVLERFTSLPTAATASMRSEHRTLRRLVDTIEALVAHDEQVRSLSVLCTLRSVLLLHLTKEQWVLHPLMRECG